MNKPEQKTPVILWLHQSRSYLLSSPGSTVHSSQWRPCCCKHLFFFLSVRELQLTWRGAKVSGHGEYLLLLRVSVVGLGFDSWAAHLWLASVEHTEVQQLEHPHNLLIPFTVSQLYSPSCPTGYCFKFVGSVCVVFLLSFLRFCFSFIIPSSHCWCVL